MNLTRLPSDPAIVVDLDKVTHLECSTVYESGTIMFPTSKGVGQVNVELTGGWVVYVILGGIETLWSGTSHEEETDALEEMKILANKISWGRGILGGFEDAR